MKTIKGIYRKALMALIVVIAPAAMLMAQGVNKGKDSLLSDLVKSRHFVFNAESVLPANGRLRILNAGERVEVNGDTLITDLPYFGRAYSAPVDPSQGGFHFTSTDFEYLLKEKKKGGWIILIKPAGNRDVQQLSLDISSKGMASLQVTSNNRQSISFNGHVAERKKL